jgi:hypothetical protein
MGIPMNMATAAGLTSRIRHLRHLKPGRRRTRLFPSDPSGLPRRSVRGAWRTFLGRNKQLRGPAHLRQQLQPRTTNIAPTERRSQAAAGAASSAATAAGRPRDEEIRAN